MQAPVAVTGIWLLREGNEDDPRATVQVLAEIDGIWRTVITENAHRNFSHIVEPSGMRESDPVSWFTPDGIEA